MPIGDDLTLGPAPATRLANEWRGRRWPPGARGAWPAGGPRNVRRSVTPTRRDAVAFTRVKLEQFAEKERPHFEQLLRDFVEIPSVSADPGHAGDLERCAELGVATLRAFGAGADIHRI